MKTPNLKSIIDYVKVIQDSQVKTTNVIGHKGPCCGTDHYLVNATFYVQSERIREILYEGWNFNSGNYLFRTDTK